MDHYQNLEQIVQRTPGWYQKKSEILTSTQISSIIHLNSFRSHQDLLEKPNQIIPQPIMELDTQNITQIDPITWGTVLESHAIQLIEQSTASPSVALGLKVHDRYPFLGASPDGLQMIKGKPRLIEVKCPKKRQITYRVPVEYWVQMQIAMEVWDIDEALYCEYKFDITNVRPTTQDLTITYGNLGESIYWIYQNSWHHVIKRDHLWFQEVLPKISTFYQLKFDQQINSSENKHPTNSYNLRSRKRKRKQNNQEESNQKTRRIMGKNNVSKKSQSQKQNLVPINKLTNYLQGDPILDWLECHQPNNKRKSPFLDFYNQKNLVYKLETMNSLLISAKTQNISIKILNKSLAGLLPIYKNNLLLKLQYNYDLIEATQNAINMNIDLILMGQLDQKLSVNDEPHIWDTFDLLVKIKCIPKLFPNHPILDSNEYHELAKLQSNSSNYLPIKIRWTTLDFRSNSFYLRSKHRIDQIKIGAITNCLILDRYGNLGLIPQKNDQNKLILSGLNWLKQIKETKYEEIWPNMKNHNDSQWSKVKEQIAQDKDELTQISYMSLKNRNSLHQQGIKCIDQLKLIDPEELSDLQYSKRILPFICDELYLPELTLPKLKTSPIEVYLDFESCSSLGTGESIIFLMGILVKWNAQDLEYKPCLVDNLDKESETKMLSEGLQFLSSLPMNTPIFHWSSAEPSMLKRAGWNLPENCYWIDLYSHFVKNQATIPGCYTYGLKDVASSLHGLKKIQSRWLHGLDGTTAMTMAWNINHKCNITGEKFSQDPRIKKLCDYNYVDCVVMEEIRKLL